MSPALVLLGSSRPIAGAGGRGWHAVDGEPAFRRVELVEDAASVDRSAFGDDVSVWVGEQIDSLVDHGDPNDATALLAVGQEPAPGHEDEFNAWMDEEHVPGLGSVPGTVTAHRYRSATDEPMYYAVYHLRDLDVNTSSAWKAASKTDRSAAMKPHSRKRVRGLYQAD